MSLINDALKRAKEAQRSDSPGYVVSPMRPNTPAAIPVPKRKKRNLNWILPVMIILLVLVAFFFVAMAMAKRTVKNIATVPAISAAPQVEAVAPSVPAPPPPAPTPAPATASVAPEPSPEVIDSATNSTDVAGPPMILQGVVNDPVHPWAIVNGKTVYLGDKVNGMRVTLISRSSITLTGGQGQTTTIFVGQ
jgi:hypothetical protein